MEEVQCGARFARGLPEHLGCPLHFNFFAALDEGVFRVLPIRSVSTAAEKDFGPDYEDIRRLAATPELARLHTLVLEGSGRAWAYADYDPDAWPDFFRSDYLQGLRCLGLHNCLGEGEAVALAESPTLAGLTALDLGYNGLGPDDLRAIARSPHLAGLTEFWLGGNRIISPTEERDVLAELAKRFGAGFHADRTPQDGAGAW